MPTPQIDMSRFEQELGNLLGPEKMADVNSTISQAADEISDAIIRHMNATGGNAQPTQAPQAGNAQPQPTMPGKPPAWRGVRGVLRWLWYGKGQDNPDYAGYNVQDSTIPSLDLYKSDEARKEYAINRILSITQFNENCVYKEDLDQMREVLKNIIGKYLINMYRLGIHHMYQMRPTGGGPQQGGAGNPSQNPDVSGSTPPPESEVGDTPPKKLPSDGEDDEIDFFSDKRGPATPNDASQDGKTNDTSKTVPDTRNGQPDAQLTPTPTAPEAGGRVTSATALAALKDDIKKGKGATSYDVYTNPSFAGWFNKLSKDHRREFFKEMNKARPITRSNGKFQGLPDHVNIIELVKKSGLRLDVNKFHDVEAFINGAIKPFYQGNVKVDETDSKFIPLLLLTQFMKFAPKAAKKKLFSSLKSNMRGPSATTSNYEFNKDRGLSNTDGTEENAGGEDASNRKTTSNSSKAKSPFGNGLVGDGSKVTNEPRDAAQRNVSDRANAAEPPDTTSDPSGTAPDTTSDPSGTASDTTSDPSGTAPDTTSDPSGTAPDTTDDTTVKGNLDDDVADELEDKKIPTGYPRAEQAWELAKDMDLSPEQAHAFLMDNYNFEDLDSLSINDYDEIEDLSPMSIDRWIEDAYYEINRDSLNDQTIKELGGSLLKLFQNAIWKPKEEPESEILTAIDGLMERLQNDLGQDESTRYEALEDFFSRKTVPNLSVNGRKEYYKLLLQEGRKTPYLKRKEIDSLPIEERVKYYLKVIKNLF